MIEAKDVPMWLVLNGIGHALERTLECGFHFTLCESLTPSGKLSTEIPKRICKECRREFRRTNPLPAGTCGAPTEKERGTQ